MIIVVNVTISRLLFLYSYNFITLECYILHFYTHLLLYYYSLLCSLDIPKEFNDNEYITNIRYNNKGKSNKIRYEGHRPSGTCSMPRAAFNEPSVNLRFFILLLGLSMTVNVLLKLQCSRRAIYTK